MLDHRNHSAAVPNGISTNRAVMVGILIVLITLPGCASTADQVPRQAATSAKSTLSESPTVIPAVHCATDASREVAASEFVAGESQNYAIDLPTALRLAHAQNPVIALARLRIDEAAAQFDQARVLLLPTLSAGGSYHKHEGRLQDVVGHVIEISRTSGFAGLGAGAVGAGSIVVPGVSVRSDLADAIFLPLAARQNTLARKAESRVTQNNISLAVTLLYFELLRAKFELVIADESLANAAELARVTDEFAKAGEGLQSDAERAAVERSLRERDVERSREAVQVRSAQLAELLRLDLRTELDPLDTAAIPIEFVASDRPVAELIAAALQNRPELDQSRSLVQLACERLRHAQYGPLLPSVLLGASIGGFGGGTNSSLVNSSDRTDFDAMLFWELRNLGMGDKALTQERRSQFEQAKLAEVATMDRIASEVTQAHAQVASRRKQIELARTAVERAEKSFQLNRTRIFEKQGLPIEVLQAVQSLTTTRREFLAAVIEYNQAQFRLHTAIGQAAAEPARKIEFAPERQP